MVLAALLAMMPSGAAFAVTPDGPTHSTDRDLALTWGPADVLLTLTLPAYAIEPVQLDGAGFEQIILDDDHWSSGGQAGASANRGTRAGRTANALAGRSGGLRA